MPKLVVQRALYIGLDLADALTRAHRLNILHRDIKPGNVLIANDGTPRLTDFGVARVGASNMTAEGSLVGTLAYLSPESLTGADIDERHDIWAFGVMLFEMLAGHRPYQEERIAPLISAITTQPIPDLEELRPDVPVALVDLIYRMLEKDVNSRVRSARMVGAELESIIQGGDRLPGGIATSQARFRTTNTPAAPIVTSTISDAAIRTPQLHNFPAEVTPFVGREKEIDDLLELIADPAQRLITLVGPGGVGKTRLAMAVAGASLDRFRDGAYFVPLEDVENPDDVPLKIAEALDIEMGGAADTKQQMMDFLAEKHLLLVMDNMEQLVKGATMLADNMDKMPNVTVMVTSRERLRLRGEQTYEVDVMRVPPADLNDVDTLALYPSVELFVNGAKRNAPDFELDAENAADVGRIINMVLGIPLGIELATGWMEMLSVAEIASEIEASLDFLETDLRDVPERHRSLRAVADHSWKLLTESEQDAFMKLSLFRDGFERSAAQAITGTSLRTLTALGNKSLVFRAPDGRFTIPKLLREYAHEKFLSHCDDVDMVKQKYIQHYAELVYKLGDLMTSKRRKGAADAFEHEHDNIRHAWALAIKRDEMDAIEQMLDVVQQYHMSRSLFNDGVRQLEEVVRVMEERGHTERHGYWWAQAYLSQILGRSGDYLKADRLTGDVMAYFREVNDERGIGFLQNVCAYNAMMFGQYEQAREASKEAIILGDKLNEELISGIARGNLGYIQYLMGNLEEAASIYQQLIAEAYSRENSPIGYAFAVNNLGEITQAMGNFADARQMYRDAYEVFKETRQKRGMAFTTNNIAGILQLQGKMDEAKKLFLKAYRFNREIGDRAGIGHSLSAMGNIAFFVDQNYNEALRYYREARDLRAEIGDRAGYAQSSSEVGMTLYMLGRGEESRPFYEEAVEIGEEIGNKITLSFAYIGMGGVNLLEGNMDTAMDYFKRAIQMAQETHFDGGSIFVVASTAVILEERDFNEQAAQLIGFIDNRTVDNAGVTVLTGPLLDNLRYALRQKMGSGYDRAWSQGQSMDIDSIIRIVQDA
ncbi:MAG: tetratricopeptide repeat protein, partial [Chloroflexota bacterium]